MKWLTEILQGWRVRYRPVVICLTGLSCAGKTTLAKALQKRLGSAHHQALLLDGDEIRALFPGTGFDEASRKQHILKVGQMAAYLQHQGITAIISLINPYRETRDALRKLSKNFIEVYVSTPLEECERRDVKGMYKKARSGEIKQFTGVSDRYEEPLHPELVIDTTRKSVEECLEPLLRMMQQ